MALTRARPTGHRVVLEHVQRVRLPHDLLSVLRDLRFQRWVADALELTAILLVEAQADRAATLLGTAEWLRESLAETPAPFITEDLDRCRQRAAEALGPVRYGEHERHGRNMSSHEALAFALQALDALSTATRVLS